MRERVQWQGKMVLCIMHNTRAIALCKPALYTKPEKLVKKCLTKGNESAIICKLSSSGTKYRKKVEKTFEKPLDKGRKM